MSRVPRIRFKGFEEDWEQRKLGEIAEYKKGPFGSALRKDIFVQKGKDTVKIYEQQNAICKDWKLERYFVTKEYANKLTGFEVQGGDIIVSCAGTIGEIYEIPYDAEIGIINQALMRIKVYQMVIDKGIFIILFLNLIDKFSIVHSNGSAIKNIPAFSDLKPTIVFVPSIVEQKKIGKCFKTLDHLITLHQSKSFGHILEAIVSCTLSWEQCKWIDVVDISKNMVDPRNGKYDNLPHISPGNIESFTGQLYDNVKCVKDENLISGKFKFGSGDIIYGKINPQLGKYLYTTFSGLTSADAYVLNAKNNVTQKYLYTIIQTRNFFEYSVSVSMRSGMPKINRDELNAYSFFAPLTEEQLKIGNCILKYDHLITLHQSKLEKLQKIKKSMLESMFV